MKLNLKRELCLLEKMTVGELQERYVEVFKEPVRSRHKQYLIRRIAWRLQAEAEGGLSERAVSRAKELANIADARTTEPKRAKPKHDPRENASPATGDRRLPPLGTTITRRYKDRTVAVSIMPDGFEFEGELYKSLSAVARVITGTHINGFRFFNLGSKP